MVTGLSAGVRFICVCHSRTECQEGIRHRTECQEGIRHSRTECQEGIRHTRDLMCPQEGQQVGDTCQSIHNICQQDEEIACSVVCSVVKDVSTVTT